MYEFVCKDGSETKTKRESDVYIFSFCLMSYERMSTREKLDIDCLLIIALDLDLYNRS